MPEGAGMIDRDAQPVEFGRLLALSDGIFAIAITLLVFSIAVPAGLAGEQFPAALIGLLPKVGLMALSIAVIGSAWVAHHQLFGLVQRFDAGLIALNFTMLGLIAFVPFPHQVLGDYAHEPLAYVLYALVLGAVNTMYVAMDVWVRRRGLLRISLSEADYRRELARGAVVAAGFFVSIPFAFVLGGLTPLIWVALLPLERYVARQPARQTRQPLT